MDAVLVARSAVCAHIVKMSNVQICNLLHPLPFMHVLINLITLCTHLPKRLYIESLSPSLSET